MEDKQARLAKQQLDEKISRELMAGMQNDLSNVSAEAEDVLASLGGDLFSDDSASILTSIGKPRNQHELFGVGTSELVHTDWVNGKPKK